MRWCASMHCSSFPTRTASCARSRDCYGRTDEWWSRPGSAPRSEPERLPVDVGALVEAAGLRLLLREEPADWLERQRAMFERVVAEDSDTAEPALRSLAVEGRNFLAHRTGVRRVRVVATVNGRVERDL
jgi:hypothetical protein